LRELRHGHDEPEGAEVTMAAPFTDPTLIRGALYATSDRLALPTSALHRAKISGADAAATIAALAAPSDPAPPGSSTSAAGGAPAPYG
jgi:hypothetical protein